MPAVWIGRAMWAAGGGALIATLWKGDDVADSFARAAKWGAIAGGVYIAGKYAKAW